MRENKTKYGAVALMMVMGMIGIVAALESIPTLSMFCMAVVFFACSAVLLFCLMRLEVMDFPEGSFLYALNQQVNAPKTRARAQYRTVHSAARGHALVKGA